jgi:hypothetical protein
MFVRSRMELTCWQNYCQVARSGGGLCEPHLCALSCGVERMKAIDEQEPLTCCEVDANHFLFARVAFHTPTVHERRHHDS